MQRVRTHGHSVLSSDPTQRNRGGDAARRNNRSVNATLVGSRRALPPRRRFPPLTALPGFTMSFFGRKKTTVGLDIGSGLIKVAVIDHSGREPELTRVTVMPLLADAIVEGEVMDPGIVAEAIRSALANAGVKGKVVV